MRYGFRSKTKRGIRAEHGAVAVEFAIVLSVLMVLVFGIIDFGHAYYMRHMMSDASREGARYGTRFKTVAGSANDRILPKNLSPTTSIPPIAVDTETVYNVNPNGTLTIDISEQDLKPQSNKGTAGWFNLSGDNSVPSVRINTPLTSPTDQIYLVPGTKATLMDFVTEGSTIVLPIVDDVTQKVWKNIIGWAAFKVDSLDANSMTGHFVNEYFDPNVIPTAGTPPTDPSVVWATPKLVGPM